MTKLSRLIALSLLAVTLLFSAVAAASAAKSYLETKQKALTTIIRKPKSGANDKQIKANFDSLLDYDAFAKDSLGKYWDKQSAEERKEFQALLTSLVQKAYTKNIRDTLDYNIVFKGSQPASDGELVMTVAKHKTDARKEQIHINYLVHKVKGNWRVYDIITEGSSLVKNYKSQFRRIIEKKGFSDLLDRMRKKSKES